MKKSSGNRTVSLMAIATVVFSLTAQVAFAQEGNFENIGIDYDNRILVITETHNAQDVTYCGREFTEYKCVVIHAGSPAIVTSVAIPPSVAVSPGDRFDISGGAGCDGGQRISTQLTPK